jgi:hypothetical protein
MKLEHKKPLDFEFYLDREKKKERGRLSVGS